MNVVETIGQYITLQPVGDRGAVWRGRCPFHAEAGYMASLVVFSETESYHCFECGVDGDAAAFVAAMQQLQAAQAGNIINLAQKRVARTEGDDDSRSLG